jgi:hypothetical protein
VQRSGRVNEAPASAVGGRLDRSARDDTMRRIHDAVGVDPIDFESGYPKLV